MSYIYSRLCVALVIAFSAVFTGTAKADSYSNQVPMTDGLLLAAVNLADEYWISTGAIMPDANVVLYTTNARETAQADTPGTKIGFTRYYVSNLRKNLAAGLEVTLRLRTLCNTAVHERGHNLGYGHTDDAIYPNYVMSATKNNGPRICSTWANALTYQMRKQENSRIFHGF